jgi:NagD protein
MVEHIMALNHTDQKPLGETMAPQKNYLMDMDGVLLQGSKMIPGADQFITRLNEQGASYFVLTNNPNFTPGDLAHRLQSAGLSVPPERLFTSAMAMGRFLNSQRPNGTAFVIGESGLTEAVHAAGYVITRLNPDYVVLGETYSYNLEMITYAIRLINSGARFVATNPDVAGPGEGGQMVLACGALAALIEKATGVSPFFVGKPNPLMIRTALNFLNTHSENTIMIGDTMSTDIVAGVESGLETILVLSGVTHREDVARFPYQPNRVCESVAEIEPNEFLNIQIRK